MNINMNYYFQSAIEMLESKLFVSVPVRLGSVPVRLVPAGKMSFSSGKMSFSSGKISFSSGKISFSSGKISFSGGKISFSAGKISFCMSKKLCWFWAMNSIMSNNGLKCQRCAQSYMLQRYSV